MSERMELLWRLVAFVWLATAGWLITVVAGILAIFVLIADVVVVLIRGKGLSDGRVSGFVVDSIRWNADQGIFILVGKGGFQALPG